ncbi:probable cytochrome P450 313a4 [Bradysia coprophila]|uniref:probable cytochrome P450 313a4 n=1 Tax=Bradysia coprophila TaxID=38358 RepID=UPI00187D8E25|nr:probable cytochrome P450 313a4 [Bradysia coprophila]
MIVFSIFITVVLIIFLNYCWKRRNWYRASWNLPGILSLPIIGGAYIFWNTTDILARGAEYLQKIGAVGLPFGFWLGPRFAIIVTSPEDAEIVINHPSSMHKGSFYEVAIEGMGGQGLLTASGDYWKYHRKLLDPTIQNTKILNSYYPTINSTLRILMDILNEKSPNETFDIFSRIDACSFDLFAKSTLGVDCNVQREHCSFFESLNEALVVVRKRVLEPMYNIRPIFRLSKLYPMAKRATAGMRAVVQDIIRKRMIALASSDQSHQVEDEYEKRLRIFVDEAIQLTTEQKCFTEDELINESLTILMTGFETSAVSIANTVLMLAMHPQYQEKVYEEIQKICPNNDGDVTSEHLKELLFTEQCIKESMRLIPTVPLTSRLATEDFYIGETYVPAGCEVALFLYVLHRNKNVWGNDANIYNPDRFLPERFEKQHPYSYLPYSAGPRNCIGKKYAQIVIRMFIVWLVRNFKFTTDLKFEELSLKWMVVLKANQGYPVRIEKRLAK